MTESYKTAQQIGTGRLIDHRKHYFYPNIPPKNIGRGDTHNLQDWLEDNPQCTEADFYWLRQKQ